MCSKAVWLSIILVVLENIFPLDLNVSICKEIWFPWNYLENLVHSVGEDCHLPTLCVLGKCI